MLDNQSTLTSCVTRYAAFDHTVLAIGPECCSTEPFTSVWPVIRLLNSQTALRLRNRRVQSRGIDPYWQIAPLLRPNRGTLGRDRDMFARSQSVTVASRSALFFFIPNGHCLLAASV